jgi:hypothetical protein
VDKQRAGGITAIALLNIVVGGLEMFAGIFQLLGVTFLMLELARQGVPGIPMARLSFSLLVLATGIVGLVAGIGLFSLRPSARTLSFLFAGMLVLSAVLSWFTIPIIASIGTYDIRSIGAGSLTRLIIFCAVYVVVPVLYSLVLSTTLNSAALRNAFATASPPPLIGR